MTAAEPALLRVERPLPGVAVVTLALKPPGFHLENAVGKQLILSRRRVDKTTLADPTV